MERAWILVLAALALSAGCLGGAELDEEIDPAEEETEDRAQEETEDRAQEETEDQTEDQTEDGVEDEGEREVVEHPFEGSGEVGVNAMICDQALGFGCWGSWAGNDRFLEAEPPGTVQEATLTMTWDDPTPRELRLGLNWDCTNNGCDSYTFVDGQSPLTLERSGLDETGTLQIWAWAPPVSAEAASVVLTTPQEFTVEGTFESSVPAE